MERSGAKAGRLAEMGNGRGSCAVPGAMGVRRAMPECAPSGCLTVPLNRPATLADALVVKSRTSKVGCHATCREIW